MIKYLLWLLWPTCPTEGNFDIEGVDVFAIERINDTTTCIGYTLNGERFDYHVICHADNHRTMALRFRNKIEAAARKKAERDSD